MCGIFFFLTIILSDEDIRKLKNIQIKYFTSKGINNEESTNINSNSDKSNTNYDILNNVKDNTKMENIFEYNNTVNEKSNSSNNIINEVINSKILEENNVKLENNFISNNNSDINNELKVVDFIDKNIYKDDSNSFLNINLKNQFNLIYNRGPDYQKYVEINLNDNKKIECESNNTQNLPLKIENVIGKNFLYSSVLSLRGFLVEQPLISKYGILMYNGEIYDENLKNENDTLYLSNLLYDISKNLNQNNNKDLFFNDYSTEFFKKFDKLDSDHAFINLDIINNCILINRDIFAKRSLILVYFLKYNSLMIVSTLSKEFQNYIKSNENDIIYFELPNDLFIIDLNCKDNNFIKIYERTKLPSNLRFNVKNIENFNIREDFYNYDNDNLYYNFKEGIKKRLFNSVSKRVYNYRDDSIALLFSGGLDSTLLAYMIYFNKTKKLDLFNISFSKNSPDRVSSLISFWELLNITQDFDKINLILIDIDYEECLLKSEEEILELIYPCESHMDFNISASLKYASNQGQMLKSFLKNNEDSFDNKKRMMKIVNKKLFYKIMEEYFDKLRINDDLINNKQNDIEDIQIVNKYNKQDQTLVKNEKSVKEKKLKKNKKCQDKEIIENIDNNEIILDKNKKIKRVDFSNEILSKQVGNLIDFLDKQQEDIISKNSSCIEKDEIFIKLDNFNKSKVVFSGFGADEFFCGYARYRTAFNHKSFEGLIEEMSLDINRVWYRNFGRDDRSCSDNSIELRFPFFDLELLEFLSKFPIKFYFDFTDNRGEGEKKILRDILKEYGFKYGSKFEKRAIQFGTCLAKKTNIKKFGSNRKANGNALQKLKL